VFFGNKAGLLEGNGQATEVGLQVNPGGETATRAAKRLIMLPPFASAAETWARTAVESNICTKCAVSLIAARASKNASKVPDRLSRKHAVPVPEFVRKPAKWYYEPQNSAGLRETFGRSGLIVAPRLPCREHPQYNRPILFRHGREPAGVSSDQPLVVRIFLPMPKLVSA
jgi:hypothetical protein